jgi:2-iminobutanoate/2-iminopropanoate deaminase
MKAKHLLALSFATVVAVPSAIAQSPPIPSLRAVTTDDAPKAGGPYSQAIVSGGFLYAAGQTPRDPKTGKQVSESFELAAIRVLDNLEAVLKAEGLDWTDVVKTTVYLTKSEDFAPLNTIYAQRMGAGKPARTTVIVAALPGGALVEMDLIARMRR